MSNLVIIVQYNLVPAELVASEVRPSGLLDNELLLLAYEGTTGGSVDARFGKKPEKLAALLHQVCQLQNRSCKLF